MLSHFSFIQLTIVSLLFAYFSLLASSSTSLPHHTDSGFKNNYLPKERMSKSLGTVFKWRFTRNSQEKVNFESDDPDIDFLKSNKTEETLTWIGHSTFLWQYKGINLITDPHLTERASPVGVCGSQKGHETSNFLK